VTAFPEQFLPVCRYTVRNGKPEDVEWCEQALLAREGVVYARLCEATVLYIGSTDRILQSRIREHLRLVPKPLNQAYAQAVECKRVTIVAYWPEPIELFGRPIRVHRALEAALIAEFKPPHVRRAP